MTFEEMTMGKTYQEKFVVSDNGVRTFAKITGDTNPLHLDEEFAKTTMFKQRIAHGMYVASFISKVLGRNFPGDGTIYMAQQIKFKRPVFINEEVTVEVEVISRREDKKILTLRTDVINGKGVKVITGEATVMKP